MNNQLNMLMQLISLGQNPNQVIAQMAKQNPQANAILNQVQQSGMTPKEYAIQYARQNNIDITPLLNMLNNKGIKL